MPKAMKNSTTHKIRRRVLKLKVAPQLGHGHRAQSCAFMRNRDHPTGIMHSGQHRCDIAREEVFESVEVLGGSYGFVNGVVAPWERITEESTRL